ncbi:hypothetical protein RF11_01737 [Thelohanellus kitauei]|uniref:Uncharacterized protein n=1 Tax=Thelohanellus kitauei TaxID=669202 RepID=A0A0C2MXG1_THEKT|nr:hypothetical protein RF11_01737 [Thelohanellus kitauei]
MTDIFVLMEDNTPVYPNTVCRIYSLKEHSIRVKLNKSESNLIEVGKTPRLHLRVYAFSIQINLEAACKSAHSLPVRPISSMISASGKAPNKACESFWNLLPDPQLLLKHYAKKTHQCTTRIFILTPNNYYDPRGL